ncbi:MAG: hypothetical protein K8I01_10630 [Candidatus Methylomirabilis sp.]|nr:hypothetical protein [Deltaproteobacteria bacterium]
MSFVSLKMLLWIAATVAAYWAAPRHWRPYAVSVSAAVLLAFVSPLSLGVLAFFTALGILPLSRGRHWIAGALTAFGSITAVFIWFRTGAGLGGPLVPLGFGFYTLRALHYVLDGIKGTLPPHTFREFVNYMFFLPVLVAGPINRFQEFHRNLSRYRFDPALFSNGCERILYGFVKVVFLANYEVSNLLAGRIEKIGESHAVLADYLECLRYGLNLYFQFSGYSDIAIGFSMLLGFKIAENFNYPFLAKNINDFWRRWHISLSSWCRDYVYMFTLSIGRRPWAAVIVSMLVLGIWHEVSLRYVAWGVYHGAGIAVWQGFQRFKAGLPFALPVSKPVADWVSWFFTMNFVILGFAITKEPDLPSGLAVIGRILFFRV